MDTNFRPAGIGDNSLAAMQDNDRLPALLHEAQELAGVVDVWVMRVPAIEDEEQAGKARDLLAKLTARIKEAEDARVAEKEPHLAAGRAVDARYKPVGAMLSACVQPIKTLLGAWLKREQARIDAEKAAARAEADRLAREAEAARKAAEAAGKVAAAVAAEQAAERAQAAAVVARQAEAARPQVVSASGGARKASLRVTYAARLVNFPIACRRYANHPEVVAVLEKLASAEARAAKGAGIIPGFEIVAQETVA